MTIDTIELKKAAEACDVTKCADEAEWDRRFSEFLSECDPDVTLALLADIANTENRLHDVAVLCATVEQERDQLKAYNEALRKDAERYRWLRDEDYLHNWADVHVCDESRRAEITDAAIDAAMGKEASHA